jgi:hypothetical protein
VKGLRQEGGIGRVANERFGSGPLEFRKFALRPAQRAYLLAGVEQRFSNFLSGVAGCSHYGDHVVLLCSSGCFNRAVALSVHPFRPLAAEHVK